jgi:hypothetical protein
MRPPWAVAGCPGDALAGLVGRVAWRSIPLAPLLALSWHHGPQLRCCYAWQ